MLTCDLCYKQHESLREANHKEFGKKWICQECWTRVYEKNQMVSGSSSGSGGTFGSCGIGCPGCRKA
jgi:hypothetical protein